MIFGKTDYRYVERNVSRHGGARYYFRAPGAKRVRLPDPSKDYEGFLSDHQAMMADLMLARDLPPPIRKREPAEQPTSDERVRPREFEKIIAQSKARADRKRVPHELTISWAHAKYIEQDGKCAVSGIALQMPSPGIKSSPYQISIDRVAPSKGYIEDNCRLVILAVNLAMNIWGEAAFKRLAYRISAQTLLDKSGL